MVFFGKSLLQSCSCVFHQNIFTEARMHQKSAAVKSVAHFTLGEIKTSQIQKVNHAVLNSFLLISALQKITFLHSLPKQL